MNEGTIVQIIGPVVDIDFPGGVLPSILNAVTIPRKNAAGAQEELIVEVQQHLGDNRVRTVAMDSTDGLVPGHEVRRYRGADYRAGGTRDARVVSST